MKLTERPPEHGAVVDPAREDQLDGLVDHLGISTSCLSGRVAKDPQETFFAGREGILALRGRGVRAPWPVARMRAESGRDRIEDDVEAGAKQVPVIDDAARPAVLGDRLPSSPWRRLNERA